MRTPFRTSLTIAVALVASLLAAPLWAQGAQDFCEVSISKTCSAAGVPAAVSCVVPAGTDVTYTYVVSNVNPFFDLDDVTVGDDHLGPIGNTGPIPVGAPSVVLTANATIGVTTTNVATADGSAINGLLLCSDTATATVTVEEPPAGGQGCTPGYWKQRHHFGAWIGFAPGDDFAAVFGRDVGGLSLWEALRARGGGLDALLRHTVAALLSASHPGVSYPLTTSDVISAFQAAYDSGDVEPQKDAFAELNEAGCPL